jgi:hypothetical protein
VEVNVQFHAPAALPPRRIRLQYSPDRVLLSLTAILNVMKKRKSPDTAENQTPTIQPVADHYAD